MDLSYPVIETRFVFESVDGVTLRIPLETVLVDHGDTGSGLLARNQLVSFHDYAECTH